MLTLDHTKRSDFVTCPRKFQLKYIKGITPRRGSSALRYGVAWHGVMEGFYEGIATHGWGSKESVMGAIERGKKGWERESAKYEFDDADYRNLPNLMQSFMKYVEHFHFDEGILRIIAPEVVFKVAMFPTAFETTNFLVEPFYFAGMMDCEVELNGRPWILEHKTTGQPLSMQISRLHRSPQVIGYNYAARATSLLHEIPDGSIICMHHLSAYKSKVTGNYGDPKIDFARSPQIFSMEDLANWRLGLMKDAALMQNCVKTDCFPMNHYSCYNYGACTYVNLCEQNRPVNQLILQDFKIEEPWDVTVTGEEEGKLKTVIETEEDRDRWQSIQQRI